MLTCPDACSTESLDHMMAYSTYAWAYAWTSAQAVHGTPEDRELSSPSSLGGDPAAPLLWVPGSGSLACCS